MYKKLAVFFIIFYNFCAFAQTTPTPTSESTVIDSLYREDQFYTAITFNLPQNKPGGFSQRGISAGVSLGFLRDMPINKQRNWAVAAGLGYNYNNLVQNIKITENAGNFTYAVAPTYDQNSLDLHYIDLPLELRWRTSTITNTNFYRIYAGFKASYLFYSKSNFESSTTNSTITNNPTLSKWVVGPYLSLGNGTINFYAYYALTPIVKNQQIDGNPLKINAFNMGFIFYML